MCNYNYILFRQFDGIGVISINRPEALNALNAATLAELNQICDYIAGDNSIKVVIITGNGDKSFVAGADIVSMQPLTALEGRKWAKFGQSVFNKIENLPQPVIAAVNGFALGGGCELAMACDIRIASEKAKFAQPEVSLGISPGFGGTQRLTRLIGLGRAKELLFTGEMIDAQEAYRIGLVNKVVKPEELVCAAQDLAQTIAAKAPVAVQMCKAAVNKGFDVDIETGSAYEAEVFGLCFATHDQKEGMSAFMEKRNPNFIGE